MSSGFPGRFMGEVAAVASTLSGALRSIGVSTKPGGTLLTVMPRPAYSIASAFVSPITPPFEATSVSYTHLEHLGAIRRKRGDTAASSDAQAAERLNELTRRIAHPADREHVAAVELEQRTLRSLIQGIDQQVGYVQRSP